MKIKHLLIMLVFFALAISFGSCTKDEDLTTNDAGSKNKNIVIEELRAGDEPPIIKVKT